MKPRDIAEAYGLKTADQIDPPQPRVPSFRRPAVRWTTARKMVFQTVRPLAICFVATDGPVSVNLLDPDGGVVERIGHNRGVWAAKLVKSSARTDSVTAQYDRNPFFALGTQFRVWTPRESDRERLLASVLDLIAARAEEDGGLHVLRNGFDDLGPNLDLGWFETEIHDIARRLGVRAWSDEGLVAWFDQIWDEAKRVAAAHGRAAGPRLIEKIAFGK